LHAGSWTCPELLKHFDRKINSDEFNGMWGEDLQSKLRASRANLMVTQFARERGGKLTW
jgi:hypothetical protein